MVPTFRRFWTLRTSKMHFREPSGARSGNVPSPLGPSWRAFRFSAPPPRGPQDASGRQFDVPKHPRSHPKRPPRIPRYPKSAKVQFWDSKSSQNGGPRSQKSCFWDLHFHVCRCKKKSDISFYDLGPQSSHVWRFRPRWMCTTNPIQTLHEPVHPFTSSDYPEKLEKFENKNRGSPVLYRRVGFR